MSKERPLEAELSGYFSNLLRTYFGKGPTSVHVSIRKPYIAIYFKGFITPTERILLKQGEEKRVLEIRDLLLIDLKPQILEKFSEITGMVFEEVHADWNLASKTGIFLSSLDEQTAPEDLQWPEGLDRDEFHRKIIEINEAAEKTPGHIESIWLSKRVLLVKRVDILVGIEKALIKEGYTEILKLTKRPLERGLLRDAKLETILKREISEIFLDWNFSKDSSYIAFVLEPRKQPFQ